MPLSRRSLIPFIVLTAMSIGFLAWPALAGPVTGGAGVAPFAKSSVYNGVLSIVPGAGTSVMEIGYQGTDIAGSGDIFLRPGSGGVVVPQADAVRIFKNGSNKASISIGGSLCFYGTGTEVCKDKWESGGPGGNNWQLAFERDPVWGDINYLQPEAIYSNDGVRIGSAGSPLTTFPAVMMTGSGFTDVFNKDPIGYAVRTEGNMLNDGRVDVYETAKVNGNEVWYPSPPFSTVVPNEGEGSGLDADSLDGVNVTLENASSCVANPSYLPPYTPLACLCFGVSDGVGGTEKKCIDFSNHPYP